MHKMIAAAAAMLLVPAMAFAQGGTALGQPGGSTQMPADRTTSGSAGAMPSEDAAPMEHARHYHHRRHHHHHRHMMNKPATTAPAL